MINFIIFLMYFVFFIPLIVRFFRLRSRKSITFQDYRGPFIVAITGVIVVSIFLSLINFQVNFLWFRSVGFLSVFLKRIWVQVALYIAGFLIALAIYRLAFYIPVRREELELGEKIVNLTRKLLPIILALISASFLTSNFMKVLMYFSRVDTPTLTDPVFGKQVSFYLFEYPFWVTIISYLIGIFAVALVIEEIVYTFYIKVNFPSRSPISLRATNLLSIIAGILLALIGVRIYLNMYSLLLSSRGAVFGVGYADYYVRIPIYRILSIAFIGCSIFLFIYAAIPRFTSRVPVIRTLAVVIVVGLIAYAALPSVFQLLVVKPNELARENKFLENNIKGTREAFALDKIDAKQIPDIIPLTYEALEKEKTFTENLRFWDWRALRDTYQQIQSIRLYYAFSDIDIDRYIINGDLRELLLGVRELDQTLLPDNSKTWVNLHLKYTHGYGVCINTVNEFTGEGLPNLLVKDIPPVSTAPELNIERPEIYFGELTDNYIFVNTTTPEFDYPRGEENVNSFYAGNRGIAMNPLNRLVFALQYRDVNIILSRYLNSQSRILINRNVTDRVNKVAPFLEFGSDPYIVVGDDGKLYWMGDAFTYSSLYPYSEPFQFKNKRVNYVRNSIKFVVDSYTGDIVFYIIDETDPLAQVYRNIFPALFKSGSDMPEFLKRHIRYPDEMMQVQGEVLSVYHMTQPEVFYNKEDKWAIAQEKYHNTTQEVIPYFSILNISNGNSYEFVNVYPFTPSGKNNLTAFLVAQCDPPYYGRVTLYQFSKDKLYYGPLQIEARIDQDSEMSRTLTLWNQQGSEVIRGNTLVLPINNSLLYMEPIYLQANTSRFPQIKKIVLATQNKIVWGDTFDDAVKLLFGEEPQPPTEVPESKEELITSAYEHFIKYREYVSQGEFELAGKELEAVESILKSLTEEP